MLRFCLSSSTGCSQARSLSFTANPLRKRNSNPLPKPPPPYTRPFDLCERGRLKYETSPKVVVNKDADKQCSGMCDSWALRPGMVLLKGYLTLDQQVSIVRECRRLGVGAGGFYRPKANVHRWLMCLGLDWNPYTVSYNKIRRFDKVRPPAIPHEFLAIINASIYASRACMEKKYAGEDVEKLVPMISPDISLVNFYPTGGELVFHQDRSESRKSLAKRIPIVSMAIGDSGVFCYGDQYCQMHKGRAEKVLMESGDVLIFGGPSRHVIHGLQSVIPNTAPESLLQETGLRPGRLNLTFRQY